MPTYSAQQRAKIHEFAAVTATSESRAAKILKSHDWNVEAAVDAFFLGQAVGSNNGSGSNASTTALNKLFDKYRDAPASEPDTIGVEGAMRYLQDLKVQLDDIAVLALGEALQAPTMGEFTRDGFVKGWRNLNKADTIALQQSIVQQLRQSIPQDFELFRRIYRYTFELARTSGQKAVALDAAVEYWRLLFGSSGGVAWSTATTPWLEWWLAYVQEKWRRSVNRDMWNMTLEFFAKSRADESLAWWDEQGAWPGVIDDFVLYVNDRRRESGGVSGGGLGQGEGEAAHPMEVE